MEQFEKTLEIIKSKTTEKYLKEFRKNFESIQWNGHNLFQIFQGYKYYVHIVDTDISPKDKIIRTPRGDYQISLLDRGAFWIKGHGYFTRPEMFDEFLFDDMRGFYLLNME